MNSTSISCRDAGPAPGMCCWIPAAACSGCCSVSARRLYGADMGRGERRKPPGAAWRKVIEFYVRKRQKRSGFCLLFMHISVYRGITPGRLAKAAHGAAAGSGEAHSPARLRGCPAGGGGIAGQVRSGCAGHSLPRPEGPTPLPGRLPRRTPASAPRPRIPCCG